MHERVDCLSGGLVTVDQDLEREFETRLVECSTLAYRVAFSVLRHREDAEDAAQEAFARAHRCFRQLRDRERFRAWLVRMTWRIALDRQRAERRRVARERSGGPAVSGLQPTQGTGDRSAELWQAMDALPEKLRVVLVLAAIEGHSIRELASLLGLPEGTVKSRLSLARQALRRRLQWTSIDSPSR